MGRPSALGRRQRTIRRMLYREQACICPYCGFPMVKDRTIDHVFAKSLGGHDGLGNMLAMHKACNNDKGNRMPTGCEVIWLVAVCERINLPVQLKPGVCWRPPSLQKREAIG